MREIKKILIANRGEIVKRIVQAAREMGKRTVALCPQKGDEKNFPEIFFADEYYFLGEEGISGFLNQKKIIEIAKKARVDALHPGYGFLAENADFAKLCETNGIKFLGPKPETIKTLGNKILAKKIAKKLKIPVIEGGEKSITNEKELFSEIKKVGFPFIFKAANGGGGRGMTIVEKKEKSKIKEIFEKLSREMETSFGSKEIFMERFIKNPHHIEFQILGDGKGKALCLYERECSIQRRHQKLIEEAPSPFLSRKEREKIKGVVLKIAKYIKYKSAGTIEFLVDEEKNFYFLEVNPRLQVEHPITEKITGVDIVKEQIKIAETEELSFSQRDIKISGHAIEFRINAEDPFSDFLPSLGKIEKIEIPCGKGIEIHTFLKEGVEILPYFDSLIMKFVVYGSEREEVIERAKMALSQLKIKGPKTTLPLFLAILENEKFKKGIYTTEFLKKEKNFLEKEMRKIKKEMEKESFPSKEIDKKEMAKILARIYFELKKEKDFSKKEISLWQKEKIFSQMKDKFYEI